MLASSPLFYFDIILQIFSELISSFEQVDIPFIYNFWLIDNEWSIIGSLMSILTNADYMLHRMAWGEIVERQWSTITWAVLRNDRPLPLQVYSRTKYGNKYILVAMDSFDKWVEAYAIPHQEASTVEEVLIKEIFSLHSDFFLCPLLNIYNLLIYGIK